MSQKLTLILLSSLLAACGTPVENAPQPGDVIDVPGFQWRIVDKQELEAAYVELGQPFNEGDRLHGFMGYTLDEPRRAVIYTLPPKAVDDQPTCTLGHEVLHIALGNYHPAP